MNTDYSQSSSVDDQKGSSGSAWMHATWTMLQLIKGTDEFLLVDTQTVRQEHLTTFCIVPSRQLRSTVFYQGCPHI